MDDYICDTALNGSTPASGLCTLRAAIQTANRRYAYDGSASSISFAAGVTAIQPVAYMPCMDGPMTINGNSVELNGSLFDNDIAAGLCLKGGSSTVSNMTIRNFRGYGILLSGGNSTIQDCDIRGNGVGISVVSPNNTIARNTIVQNTGTGIAASSGNVIKGNKIGTDGALDLGNGRDGIAIGGSNNLVGAATGITPGGGPCAADCNLISGNGWDGIKVYGISNTVQGNFIGTNAAGTVAIPNSDNGIETNSDYNNFLGNLISGNGGAESDYTGGIRLTGGAEGNIIRGNIIGANLAGTAALGNLGAGILVDSANRNVIGGDPGDPLPGRCEGRCNLIVGNSAGITITQSTRGANHVIGNFIGMDVNGSAKLPNQGDGVWVQGVDNTIANNLISGNAGQGIHVYGDVVGSSTANTNTIQSNLIGVARDGITDMGNGGHGVWIHKSTNNIVGGTGYDVVNTIAFNRGKGVVVSKEWNATIGNRILGNAIHSNSSLGLDLNDDGVTQNDGTDADTGPNDLQNYPVISGVTMNAHNVTLSGTLTSTVNTAFRLEFYANDTCDPSGYGEGKYYLGSADVTTNGSGRADFAVTLFNALSKHTFTATATDPDGNTSEFSMCAPPSILLKDSTPTTQIAPGQEIVYTLALTYTSGTGATVHGALTDPLSQYTDYISGSLTWSRGQASYVNGRVAWQGDLNDGQNVIVRYRVKVKGCEDLFAPDNWPRQIHNVVTATLGEIQLVAGKDLELLKPDLVVTGIEATQGIQNLSNDVALVKGKETLVRVFVKSIAPPGVQTCDVPNVQAAVTSSAPGGPVNQKSLNVVTARSQPDTHRPDENERRNLDQSLNFYAPQGVTWVVDAAFRVQVNPDCQRPDANCENNQLSGAVPTALEPPLNLYLYHVRWFETITQVAQLRSIANPVQVEDQIRDAFAAMYPFPQVNLMRRKTVFYKDFPVESGCRNPQYAYTSAKLRSLLTLERKANNSLPITDTVIYGYMDTINCATRGEADRSLQTASGRTRTDTAAHELGHIFGLKHVDGKPDDQCPEDLENAWWNPFRPLAIETSYPYPDGIISGQLDPDNLQTFYGLDFTLGRRPLHPRADPARGDARNTMDIMTYCEKRWVSKFTWDKIRNQHPLGGTGPVALAPQANSDYLMVSGLISLTQDITPTGASLFPVYRLPDTPPQPAPVPGEYAIRLLSETTILASYPLSVAYPVDIYGQAEPVVAFVELVPYVTGTTRIELVYSSTVMLGARVAGSRPPTVAFIHPQGGESLTGTVAITWTASDADGDKLGFAILYSRDNGQTWQALETDLSSTTLQLDTTTLSGSDQARLRIIATDGINTGQATSSAFNVARKAPQPTILWPEAGEQYPVTSMQLRGAAWDEEDGDLPGTVITWTDSISGVLGTGGSLYVSSLAQGVHTITLTARDGDGMTGAHEVRIFVGWRQYLPIVLRQ